MSLGRYIRSDEGNVGVMNKYVYELGELVVIKDTEKEGRITGILQEQGSIQFRIRIWDDHNQYQHWLYDYEIMKRRVV